MLYGYLNPFKMFKMDREVERYGNFATSYARAMLEFWFPPSKIDYNDMKPAPRVFTPRFSCGSCGQERVPVHGQLCEKCGNL